MGPREARRMAGQPIARVAQTLSVDANAAKGCPRDDGLVRQSRYAGATMVTTRVSLLLTLGFLVACGLPTQGTRDDVAETDGGLVADAEFFPDAADAADRDAAEVDARAADSNADDSSVDAGNAGNDAAPAADAQTDSSSDSSAPVDAAADARADGATGDACSPQGSEDCTNGRDDDCDGLVDCADPECAPQYECVPEVPSGWTKAALSVGSRPACPGGYASPRDVVMGLTGAAAACVCTCNSSGSASCVKGNVTFYGPSIIGSDCSTFGSSSTSTGDGACQSNLPFGLFGFGMIGANANVRVTNVALTPNTCSGSVQKTVPPAVTTEGARCLASSSSTGGGCTSGQVCARRTGSVYQSCVAKTGVSSCPATWPTKRDTGTGLSDTRNCGSCTCGTTAVCGPATLTFSEDNSCGGASVSVAADNACHAMSTPGQNVSSWRYASQVQNEGCQKTADAQPTGAVSLTSSELVCCR